MEDFVPTIGLRFELLAVKKPMGKLRKNMARAAAASRGLHPRSFSASFSEALSPVGPVVIAPGISLTAAALRASDANSPFPPSASSRAVATAGDTPFGRDIR